jgi:hypothetical protein
MHLNSSDPLYNELRDLNYRQLGAILHRKGKEIKETYRHVRARPLAALSASHALITHARCACGAQ